MKRDNFLVPNNAVAAAYPPPLDEVGRPPVAFAVKVTAMSKGRRWFRGSRTRGQVTAWIVEVECPYGCKRPHTHGSGYYVVVPSSLVASAVAAVES